jgi:hypothetical protein
MPKQDGNAERAAKLVEVLKQQRELGAGYPLPVARLRELADPQATDEELFAALLKKPHAQQFTVAAKNDSTSPVALAEDAGALAASPLLLEYALGKLASAERPTHLGAKAVAQVDKSLRPAFAAAINERLASGTLPDSVGRHEVKGKVLLYLKQFPPPPPPPAKKAPAVALAEQMLSTLTARQDQGTSAVPLSDLVGPDVKPSLVKKAIAEEPFRSGAVVLPVSRTLSLAALSARREALLSSDELLQALLDAKTSAKKPFSSVLQLANALPEGLRAAFIATQGRKVEAGTLPEVILVRQEGESRVLCLKSHLPPLVVLGEKVLAALHRRREIGDYPMSLESLLSEIAPESAAEAAKLAGDKSFKKQVIQALPGDPGSPLGLPGDEERLVSSPALVEFAVGLLSTREKPLHPVSKVVGKVDKAIRPRFEAALQRHIENNTLPASVAVDEVKGKPHLRLSRYLLPREAAEVLAEKLLAGLRSARDAGTYPLPLSELVTTVEAGAADKLVKLALERDRLSLVTALPGSMTSLVALAGDHDRLASDPRLVTMALTALRAPDNQAVPLADLPKKLAPELKPTFVATVERSLAEGTLATGVGSLVIKKKPWLFLLSDLKGAPTATAPHPPSLAQAGQAPPLDFARRFDEAFAMLARESHGLVSLVRLRQEVPVERSRFDSELNHLRRAGRYTLTPAESRHGISPEERAAGIIEQGTLFLYVSKREEG